MNKILFALFFIGISYSIHAQDDLLDLVDDDGENVEEVKSVFKGSRVVLGHSTKTKKKGELDFLISHRFGRINTGSYTLWGLDDARIRLGLEYGITDDLNVAIGRSSYDKTFDTFVKYKFIKQKTVGNPVSMVAFSSLTVNSFPRKEEDSTIVFKDRLAYTAQLLISRKINSNLSFQLSPIFVHKNRFDALNIKENTLAIGIASRYKITPSVSFNLEYFYRLNAPDNSQTNDVFSVGFDIETGGHVFQLHFTNSIMSVEKAFLTEVQDDFFDGDIHFGFNISRTFQLSRPN